MLKALKIEPIGFKLTFQQIVFPSQKPNRYLGGYCGTTAAEQLVTMLNNFSEFLHLRKASVPIYPYPLASTTTTTTQCNPTSGVWTHILLLQALENYSETIDKDREL